MIANQTDYDTILPINRSIEEMMTDELSKKISELTSKLDELRGFL